MMQHICRSLLLARQVAEDLVCDVLYPNEGCVHFGADCGGSGGEEHPVKVMVGGAFTSTSFRAQHSLIQALLKLVTSMPSLSAYRIQPATRQAWRPSWNQGRQKCPRWGRECQYRGVHTQH